MLWDSLRSFIQSHEGNFILFGDLNKVIYESERFGSSFSSSDAAVFNSFIHDVGLIDLPMGAFELLKCWLLDGFLLAKVKRLKLQLTALDKFSCHDSIDNFPSMSADNRLSNEDLAQLDSMVTMEEIKNAVWMAGRQTIPGCGGRLTLIKSVLGSLGLYYMSIFKAPDAVIKSLKSIWASFFWGASGDKRKLAWIKWSNILASLDKGGLGVGSIKAFNYSLLLKWRWRMLNCPSALWIHVLKSIHGDEAGFDYKSWRN
ncbi:hypothetical protein Tco_0777788 [Tanacetum coccineum]